MSSRVVADESVIVQWPKTTVSVADDDVDLGPPIAQLLVDMGMKGTKADEDKAGGFTSAFSGPPASVAIIEAGATAASKWWSAGVVAVGGSSVVVAWLSNVWSSQPDIHRQLVIGGAIVLAVCLTAISIIVSSDLRARGQAAASQYRARADVAVAFLSSAPLGSDPVGQRSGCVTAEDLKQILKDIKEVKADVRATIRHELTTREPDRNGSRVHEDH
jgi:hypothetical protein